MTNSNRTAKTYLEMLTIQIRQQQIDLRSIKATHFIATSNADNTLDAIIKANQEYLEQLRLALMTQAGVEINAAADTTL